MLQRFLDRTPGTDHSVRMLRAIVLLLLGLSVGTGAAAADIYLHRGIESGAEQPYVVQTTGRELAINVDLLAFPEDQLEPIAAVLESNGYRYVRQSFAWSIIEPQRGAFAWDRIDRIVDVLGGHGIQVVAVMNRSPGWARAPDQTAFPDAPPISMADYSTYAGEVVRRYEDRVQYFQVWDAPNRADQWGGVTAEPGDYLRLLAAAFNATRSANSEAKVILAEFEPGFENGMLGADLAFLRGIYRAGGAPFFDIVAAKIDGGVTSPYDRRVEASRENLSRAILFRELLTSQGDREKPIWMTHFGWNAWERGVVDRTEQSDFVLAGIKRARAEWPWLGLMFSWSLLPDASQPAEAGYAMLDAGGAGTTAFATLSKFATEGAAAIASTGFVPMDSSPITYAGNWEDQHLNRRTFRTTAETGATATLSFRGTGVIAILRISPQAGPILASVDGEPIPGWPEQDGSSYIDLSAFQAQDLPIALVDDLSDRSHVLTLRLAKKGQLTIGGLVVSRDPPLLWPVIVLVVMAVGMVAAGLRDVIYVIAISSEALQRRSGIELRPPLPRLPDWQPSRRF